MKLQTILIVVFSAIFHLHGLHAMSFTTSSSKNLTIPKFIGDSIPPVAYCITGAITISLPASGCVLVWARDLDRGSFDDITPANKLKFYFNGNRTMENIQICCSDFFAAGACDEYIRNLDMWVEDEQGNTSVCKTTVIIQDDLDACACQSTGYSIKGQIGNNCNYRSEANLKLSGPNNYYRESYGPYIRFYELTNGPYHICMERTENPLNGVTTADIVKIQRHILGLENFINYVQLLSADVNNSSTITASDVSEMRKVILGVKSKFTNTPSWIFVPSDSLLNPKHVLHVSEFKTGCYNVNIDNASLDSLRFTSIKMGDVTCSAKLTGQDKITSRLIASPIILSYSSSLLDNTCTISKFNIDKNSDLQGLQLTLEYDATLFKFDKIESGTIQLLDDQISLRDLDKGKIHIVWDKNQMERNDVAFGNLFSIQWKSKTQNSVNPIITLDPEGILPLAIDKNLNEINLVLQNSFQHNLSNINAYHNSVNQSIYLEGQIAEETNTSYSILDIIGNTILTKSIVLHKGLVNEQISISEIPTNAIYLFRIQTEKSAKTMKFLKLQ